MCDEGTGRVQRWNALFGSSKKDGTTSWISLTAVLSVFFLMTNNMTHCHDVPCLINELGLSNKGTECQLINKNEQPFVAVGHAINMKET